MSLASPLRVLRAIPRSRASLLSAVPNATPCTTARLPATHRCAFHTTPVNLKSKHDNSKITPPTDFAELDVLGGQPVPATNIEASLPRGFLLNSGLGIFDGAGALLVGGEAFAWRPWLTKGDESDEKALRLVNDKGQFDLPFEAFAALSLLWPRPGKRGPKLAEMPCRFADTFLATDLLVLGVGPTIRPISPETRRAISALGMRVEVLDTPNAVSHYNMFAMERGIDEVAGALIPLGWVEGKGAVERGGSR